ncbi:growth arrest-specific protein 1 [Dermacentor silvarum]|nr:growth arrest-specific protein 1 [Dermacentor silvarum]
MVIISARHFFGPDPVQHSQMLVLLVNLVIIVLGSGRSVGVDCGSGADVGAGAVGAFSSTQAIPRRRTPTCEEAEQDCIGRLTCGMAFHGHRLDCKRELAGRTPGRCSVHCRQSLVSLASTEEGYAYIGCECGNDDYCRALRLRLTPCWWQKPCASSTSGAATNTTGFQLPGGLTPIASAPSWSPPSSTTSLSTRPLCSQLAQDCVTDPVCSVAWDYYRRFCHEVLDGVADNCSTRCRNSVHILIRMEMAHRLLDCACDGRVTRVTCGNELNRIRTACFHLDGIEPSGGSRGPLSVDGVVGHALLLVYLLTSFGW